MILRACVLGEPVNRVLFPSSLLSLLYKAKIIKKYAISFTFAFQRHQKCFFKTSRETEMQASPPVPIIVAPTINAYVQNQNLAPTFQKTRNRH